MPRAGAVNYTRQRTRSPATPRASASSSPRPAPSSTTTRQGPRKRAERKRNAGQDPSTIRGARDAPGREAEPQSEAELAPDPIAVVLATRTFACLSRPSWSVRDFQTPHQFSQTVESASHPFLLQHGSRPAVCPPRVPLLRGLFSLIMLAPTLSQPLTLGLPLHYFIALKLIALT